MNKFTEFLSVHCHTTGINFKSSDKTEGHFPLTISLAVLSLDNKKIISSLDVQIKYKFEESKWNSKLESIHGLSYEDAINGGVDDVEASNQIALFLSNHFDISKPIPTMGFNVKTFHIPFLEKLLHQEEWFFKFDDRSIDLFPICTLINKFSIYDVIDYLYGKPEGPISSKEFIKHYLKIYKFMQLLVNNSLEN